MKGRLPEVLHVLSFVLLWGGVQVYSMDAGWQHWLGGSLLAGALIAAHVSGMVRQERIMLGSEKRAAR